MKIMLNGTVINLSNGTDSVYASADTVCPDCAFDTVEITTNGGYAFSLRRKGKSESVILSRAQAKQALRILTTLMMFTEDGDET